MILKNGSIDRRRLQQIQSITLDSITSLIVFYLIYNHIELFNPWEFSLLQWIIGGLLIRGAIVFYDYLVVTLVEYALSGKEHKKLPTREVIDKPVRYVSLDTKSIVFLSINSVHEWVFVQNLCYFLYNCEEIPKELNQLGIMNTFGTLYLMFIILDFCYAPLHHILHMPFLYPLIHKHHHRQHYPTRGYLDAGNEHPIEHFVGVLCTWISIYVTTYYNPLTLGQPAHAITIFIFFNIHAALAMLNHSPYDISWNVLGIHYSVGNHEMHHRKFTINYAQYCLWYDYAMDTYAEYEGPTNNIPKNTLAEQTTTGAKSENKKRI